ncbi:MAG: MBL fold metallo-hydrolase [Myxococcales bacterium]|nr:MBL fold metallo-hydrolase [Myxococcales bacterium]
MSEVPGPLLDSLPPPSHSPARARTCVFDRDDDGGIAWVRGRDGLVQLPELTTDVTASAEGELVEIARHESPHGLSRRFSTRIVLPPDGWEAPAGGQRLGRAAMLASFRRWEVHLDPAALHAIEPDLVGGVEVASGVRLFPLRTPTLPPATHTNCVFVGHRCWVIVDPGSPWPDEQARLLQAVERYAGKYGRPTAIVLTHHHTDHVGGVVSLSERLRLPVWAHPETAARVRFPVSRVFAPAAGALEALDGGPAGWFVGHTPGHAAGHLVLLRPSDGAVVAGDMVASVGTILVDPDDGDLTAYLASLEQMVDWLGSRAAGSLSPVHPAHGDALLDGRERLQGTLRHRRYREHRVHDALSRWDALIEITRDAYADSPGAHPELARRATLSHLLDLERRSLARRESGRWLRQ